MPATQQQINYGAVVNDGQGDPLRTAFIKTDDNFDAIWAAGPVGSNITITNNTIAATNTNGELRLQTNGVGNVRIARPFIPTGNRLYDLGAANLRFGTVYANSLDTINFAVSTLTVNNIQSDDSAFVQISDGLDVNGNVSAQYFIGDGSQLTNLPGGSDYGNSNVAAYLSTGVAVNIVPAANAVWSLGNATNQWANLWVSNNTIYIGNVAVGVTAGNVLTVAGAPVLTSTANGLQTNIGNFVFNVNALENLQGASFDNGDLTHGWTARLNLPSNGNLNPALLENTYGNISISAGANAVLTASWVFDNTGTLTTPGNISANYFIGDGSLLTNITVAPGNLIENGDSNVRIDTPNGHVDIRANTQQWTFGDDGNLTLPTNGSIIVDGGDGVIGPVSDDMVISWDNEEIRLVSVQGSIEMQADSAFRVQAGYDSGTDTYLSRWEFNQNEIVNITNNFGVVSEAGDLYLQGGRDTLSSGNVNVVAIDNGVAVNTWTFGNNGTLTTPGDITVGGDITGTAAANTLIVKAQPDSNTYIQLNSIVDSTVRIAATLDIVTDSSNTAQTWSFGTDGVLSAPGNVRMGNISASAMSQINTVANSSGDGNGYTTLELIPDESLTGTDQYLIIDPTAPGHIHIRAGGTQDNSSADLILGGEVSNVRVTAGANPPVYVSANNQSWIFGVDGVLQAPGDISTLGNISANTAGYAIGYRDIPQVSFTGNTTIAAADAGKHFYSTQSTNYTLTIADNSSVSWPVGTAISIVNRGTGNITVAQASGVSLYLAGNSTAANRIVTTYGMATLLNVAANVWMINGTGVT